MGQTHDLMKELRTKLSKNDIVTEIIKITMGGSIYIGLKYPKMGKIRIGDHKERKKYAYRWQIRTDIKEYYVISDKGHNQYLYPPHEIDNLISHITNYYKKVIKSSGYQEPRDPLH